MPTPGKRMFDQCSALAEEAPLLPRRFTFLTMRNANRVRHVDDLLFHQ